MDMLRATALRISIRVRTWIPFKLQKIYNHFLDTIQGNENKILRRQYCNNFFFNKNDAKWQRTCTYKITNLPTHVNFSENLYFLWKCNNMYILLILDQYKYLICPLRVTERVKCGHSILRYKKYTIVKKSDLYNSYTFCHICICILYYIHWLP